jgi:HEAT repeat protein/outer membrane protein assembly factor BamB
MRFRSLWLCVATLALTAGMARAADEKEDVEERTLKKANVPTDDAGLLTFLRRHCPDEAQVLDLIKKLGDDSFEVREKASADLVGLGPAAAPYLREALNANDAEVRLRAGDCLRKVSAGTSPGVLAAAARLLARRKPDGAAEVLLTFAAQMAGEISEDAALGALATLAVRDGKPEPILLKALEDRSPRRRAAAADALARGGARDALTTLRKLLRDPDPSVRLRVGLALLLPLKEKEAVPVLIELLRELPRNRHPAIEEVLERLAEDQAPDGLASDGEAARKQYRDAWAEWWKKNGDKIDLARLTGERKFLGRTMVVLLNAGRILDMDSDGKTRFQLDGLGYPLDAQRLPGDRLLITENHNSAPGEGRVTERDRKGNILWEKRIDDPLMAQRLPNGNTFITTRSQAVEVDRDGREVFTYNRGGGEGFFMRGKKLDNGDIALVVSLDSGGGQSEFVRLDASGKQLARFTVEVRTWGGRIDVLPNGRVLTPLKDRNKVVEYDGTGKIVWEADFPMPVAAVRLPNGHTIVTSFQDKRAVELDANGKTVWEYKNDERLTRAWRR